MNLYGYDTGPTGAPIQILHDVFKAAAVGSDTIDPVTGLHNFSLAYGGLVDSATPLLPSGQQGAPVTAGWNEVTNAADNNLTTSISGAPVSLPAVNPANGVVAAPTGAADVVYARFLDSNGNVVAGGWIKVDAASLGLTNSLTGPNSRATFTPLSLTLNPGSLASTLFGDEPALAKFSQIDVAVYAPGAQGALIDDYRFKTAVVSGIDDTINQAGTQTYNFKYGDSAKCVFRARLERRADRRFRLEQFDQHKRHRVLAVKSGARHGRRSRWRAPPSEPRPTSTITSASPTAMATS